MKKIKKSWGWILADKKRVVGAGVVIFLLAYGIYYLVYKNTKSAISYQTSTVTKGTIVSTVSASGKALTTNILAIDTQASGVVKKVYVKDGDKVFAGQKIAEITSDSAGALANAKAYSSLVSSQNSVNSSNNSYRSSQASLANVYDQLKGHDTDETLAQKETRTKSEVANDNAYDNLKSASANLISASLSYRLTSSVITAPYSGIIQSVNIVEGMVLTSSNTTTNINSQRAAVIKGDSFPIVNVTLSEVDVPKVKVGQKVTLTFDSLSDKSFTGVIATVDRIGTVSSNVTSYSANIKLDSLSDLILPNMAATANIILTTKTDVIKVPSTALSNSNGNAILKTLVDGNEIDVNVETGISSETETEIISGVKEGITVITGTTSASTTTTTSARSVFSGGFGGNAVRVAR